MPYLFCRARWVLVALWRSGVPPTASRTTRESKTLPRTANRPPTSNEVVGWPRSSHVFCSCPMLSRCEIGTRATITQWRYSPGRDSLALTV